MNKKLKSELDHLLAKYPELQDSELVFSDAGVEKHIKIVTTKDLKDLPNCKQREPEPDFLRGLSPKVQVQKSIIHGYGMFAIDTIEEGEFIEESKLLKLEYRSKYTTDNVIKDYVWSNRICDCIECKEHGAFLYIPLGFGSQYNHSDTPNTKQKLNFRQEIFQLWAAKRIEKGEEILVTYGDKYFLVRNFWKNVNKTKALEKVMRDKKILEEKDGIAN